MSMYNPPAIQPLESGSISFDDSPEAGEIIIGTSDGEFVLAKLTAGSGISISSVSGSITISATGGGGGGGVAEPLVATGFNMNVAYADPKEYVPMFLTTEDGDIISAAL